MKADREALFPIRFFRQKAQSLHPAPGREADGIFGETYRIPAGRPGKNGQGNGIRSVPRFR